MVVASGVLTAVEWNRILDDLSTARVTVQGGADCCGDLGNIRTWRMWLNLFLYGDFVWSGLITQVDWRQEETEIAAVDIIGLLDRRVPHRDFVFNNTDLTDIAVDLIEDGLRPDDPGHTVTVLGPSGVTGGRQYARGIGQTGDHLRDLAEGGIDFTAVGNNIVILPETFCEVVGRLSDQDLPQGLSVSEDGSALATRWVVAGQDAEVEGEAGGTDPYYGLLERYVEQTSITDADSARQAAEARLRASRVAPVFIDTQEVTLAPTAPVDITTLVPGWCLDTSSAGTCRDIIQRLKIVGVSVSETGGTETAPGQLGVKVQVAASGTEGAL